MSQSLIEFDPALLGDKSDYFLLSNVQRVFVDAYAPYLDLELACKQAHLSLAQGRAMLKKELIQNSIREIILTSPMTPQRVVARVQEIAEADWGDILKVITDDDGHEHIEFDLLSAVKKHKTGIIRSVEIDKRGKVRLTMFDKLQALNMMGKYYRLFPDSVETKELVDWKQRAREQGFSVQEVEEEARRLLNTPDETQIIDSVAIVTSDADPSSQQD